MYKYCTCLFVLEDLPHWVLSAMKCLAYCKSLNSLQVPETYFEVKVKYICMLMSIVMFHFGNPNNLSALIC